MFNFTPDDLRRRPTSSEHIMWNYLKARQMLGVKFRRQHPLGPFIVDFICIRKKIIIELDGAIHIGREFYDRKRDLWLTSQGYTILRIKNEELDQHREETLLKLRGYLLRRLGFSHKDVAAFNPTPGPSPRGEGN